MRDAAVAFHKVLRGSLTDAGVQDWSPAEGYFGRVRRLSRHPEIAEWIDFKAALAADFVGEIRLALNAVSPPRPPARGSRCRVTRPPFEARWSGWPRRPRRALSLPKKDLAGPWSG
jgi:hypothetical protein